MIEVFKTNVTSKEQANGLINFIQDRFPGYKANFDLDDCDKVLRIVAENEPVIINQVISLLQHYGYQAAVLH